MKFTKLATLAIAVAFVCAGAAQAAPAPIAADKFEKILPKLPKKALPVNGKAGLKISGLYSIPSTNVTVTGFTYTALFTGGTNAAVTNVVAGAIAKIPKGLVKKGYEFKFGVGKGKPSSTNRVGFALLKKSGHTNLFLSISANGTAPGLVTNFTTSTNIVVLSTNFVTDTNMVIIATNFVTTNVVSIVGTNINSVAVPFTSSTNLNYKIIVR